MRKLLSYIYYGASTLCFFAAFILIAPIIEGTIHFPTGTLLFIAFLFGCFLFVLLGNEYYYFRKR